MSPCHLCPLRRQPTPLSHMDSPAICSVLRHPLSKGWGVFCDFFPYLPGVPAMYGILRHPVSKGWGIFVCFSTYLLEASSVYNVLRYPLRQRLGYLWQFPPLPSGSAALIRPSAAPNQQRLGCFSRFLPLPPGLHQTPAPLSFRLQKFTLRPSNWPGVHHSAVFCTEQSRECLAYRKVPVFCTGRA